MVDVFISYKSEERDLAIKFDEALKRYNYSTWWDTNLEPSVAWDLVLEEKLYEAKIVLVLWTEKSIDEKSQVRQEASMAYAHDKLISVQCDLCKIPRFVARFEAINCISWQGTVQEKCFKELDQRIKLVLEGRQQPLAQNYNKSPVHHLILPASWSGKSLPKPVEGEKWSKLSTIQLGSEKSFFKKAKEYSIHEWCWTGKEIKMLATDEDGIPHKFSGDLSNDWFSEFQESNRAVSGWSICAVDPKTEDFSISELRRITIYLPSQKGNIPALQFNAGELRGTNEIHWHRISNPREYPFPEISSKHHSNDFYYHRAQKVTCAPDLKKLAFCVNKLDEENVLKLGIWNLDNSDYFELSTELTKSPGGIDWSPNSNYISVWISRFSYIASVDKKEIQRLPQYSGWRHFGQMSWHPTRDIFVVTSYYEENEVVGRWRLEIWDAEKLEILHMREIDHTDSVNFSAWSPDARYIAFSSHDKTVCIYDLQEDEIEQLRRYKTSGVASLEFSPDSKRLAIFGFGEGTIVSIWDHKNAREVASFPGKRDHVNGSNWDYEGNNLAVEDPNNSAINIWQLDVE